MFKLLLESNELCSAKHDNGYLCSLFSYINYQGIRTYDHFMIKFLSIYTNIITNRDIFHFELWSFLR